MHVVLSQPSLYPRSPADRRYQISRLNWKGRRVKHLVSRSVTTYIKHLFLQFPAALNAYWDDRSAAEVREPMHRVSFPRRRCRRWPRKFGEAAAQPTRKIIPYTVEIRGMFRAHQENNIAAPRGELTAPSPLEFAHPGQAPVASPSRHRGQGAVEGGKRLLRGRNPPPPAPPPFRRPKHSMVYS